MRSERINQPIAQWRTIDLRKCGAECVADGGNRSAVATEFRHVDQQWFGRDNKVLQAMDRPHDCIFISEAVLPLNFDGKMHRNHEICPLIAGTMHCLTQFGQNAPAGWALRSACKKFVHSLLGQTTARRTTYRCWILELHLREASPQCVGAFLAHRNWRNPPFADSQRGGYDVDPLSGHALRRPACVALDCFAHRARVRATRWLAMTLRGWQRRPPRNAGPRWAYHPPCGLWASDLFVAVAGYYSMPLRSRSTMRTIMAR
jgi:hypothetical protein